MTRARDIMTSGVEWIDADATVSEAALQLTESSIGALPVCDSTLHLFGMLTDRDIVTKVVAVSRQPTEVTVGEIADRDEVVTIGADDPLEEVIRTMRANEVRRLPVIDGAEMVGMVSLADLAGQIPDEEMGDLVAAISGTPPNN